MRDRKPLPSSALLMESGALSPISGGEYAHNAVAYPRDSYSRPASDASNSPTSSSSRLSGKSPPTRLIDLYYKYDPEKLLFTVLHVRQVQPLPV
jgi:hypothetical protein